MNDISLVRYFHFVSSTFIHLLTMKSSYYLEQLLFQANAKIVSGCLTNQSRRGNASGAPEKIECFVDGKKVLVDPGTTVLQVKSDLNVMKLFVHEPIYLHDLWMGL